MHAEPSSIRRDMTLTGFISFSLIVFEVFLSRFFAVVLDYNYVFLVISLATLGIGLGGYCAFSLYDRIREITHSLVGWFALSMVASVLISYSMNYQGILLYSVMSLISFFLGGTVIASIMQARQKSLHLLYFSDLLGAGLGTVAAIGLMNILGPIRTVGVLSFVVFLLYALISYRAVSTKIKWIQMAMLLLLACNVIYPILNLMPFKAYQTSPNNVFVNEKDTKVIFSEWNAFSRTDVYGAVDGELLYLTIDGGAVSPISKYSGDLRQVEYLTSTTASLAFQYVPHGRVLLIGAGGGQEVLTAQMKGFKEIEALDINAGSFRAVQALSPFSGNVFNQTGVKSIIADGRNYIRATKNKYDLIFLSLVKKNSQNGLGLALTENYIFTQEAVREYANKLTEGGRLAFLLHDEIELNKMVLAVKNVLRELGVSEVEMKNHLAVIGTYRHLGHIVLGMGGTKITRPLLLISKQPFNRSDAAALLTNTRQIEQIPIHIPYVNDQFESLGTMLVNQDIDLTANRDDKPFFYKKTNGFPKTLLWMFLAILLVAFLMSRGALSPGVMIYFSVIAIGFMILEIILIQRFILFLGHPTLSFVLVLGVLLFSGGIGSFYSKTLFQVKNERYLPILFVGVLAILINVILVWLDTHPLSLPLFLRMIVAGGMLVPLGFFMGMPFPYGLSKGRQDQVAASWGLNGIMTIAGSLLAVMLSFTFGFSTTMVVGVILYTLLFVLQPRLKIG